MITGFNIYAKQEGSSKEETFHADDYDINVKQVKIYDLASSPKVLLHFLNSGLRNVMSKLGYI